MNCPHCGKPIDTQAMQMGSGGHKYPELVQAGLGDLWTGPNFNDFDRRLVEAAQKFLKKHELPSDYGDGLNAVRNKVRQRDFGWLEQRWSESQVKPVAPKAEPPKLPAAEPWRPIWEIAGDGGL